MKMTNYRNGGRSGWIYCLERKIAGDIGRKNSAVLIKQSRTVMGYYYLTSSSIFQNLFNGRKWVLQVALHMYKWICIKFCFGDNLAIRDSTICNRPWEVIVNTGKRFCLHVDCRWLLNYFQWVFMPCFCFRQWLV